MGGGSSAESKPADAPAENVAQKEINPQTLQNAKKGPIEERECRDVLCFLLFIANIAAMIYCGVYGWTSGSPSKVYRGIDSVGGKCQGDYPFLYFNGPWGTNALQNRVCLKTCPVQNATVTTCMVNSATTSCTVNFSVDTYADNDGNWINALPANPTASYVLGYYSKSYFDRVCIPDITVAVKMAALSTNFQTFFGNYSSTFSSYLAQAVNDFTVAWPILLASVGTAFGLSIIYLLLLKCCTGVIVWFSLFGSVIAIAGLGGIFFAWSGQLLTFSTGNSDADKFLRPSSNSSNYQIYKIFAYVLWGVAGLALIIIFCLCSRIKLAIAVAKAAGSFIASTLSVLIIPLTNLIAAALVWTLCVFGVIWLLSAANFVVTSGSMFTQLESMSDPALLRMYYFFFGCLWCDALVAAYSFFIIASACALWYYSHGEESITHTPVLTSIWRGLRYHFGSLVFGALLVAIIEFIRVVYEYFAQQLQKADPGNKLVECLLCVGRCCLKCLQCIVQFINKNAYITIAITGKNFCYAAKEGFQIVWSNPLRFAALMGVGTAMSFIGNAFVSFLNAIIFYLMVTYSSYGTQIQMPYLIMVIAFLVGWVISMVFIYVFTAAMDTIVVCFILDEQVQKAQGKPKAINAPPEIAQLLENVEP